MRVFMHDLECTVFWGGNIIICNFICNVTVPIFDIRDSKCAIVKYQSEIKIQVDLIF